MDLRPDTPMGHDFAVAVGFVRYDEMVAESTVAENQTARLDDA